jgi:hypothetical protein
MPFVSQAGPAEPDVGKKTKLFTKLKMAWGKFINELKYRVKI